MTLYAFKVSQLLFQTGSIHSEYDKNRRNQKPWLGQYLYEPRYTAIVTADG